MELFRYHLCDLDLVMVDIDGVLYCSTPQLEKVFGVDRSNLSRLVDRSPEDFSNARVRDLTRSERHRKEILKSLELTRARQDTRLWSEDDVIGLTWLLRSDVARTLRVQFKEILKQHARKNLVTKELFDEIVSANTHLAAQIQDLYSIVGSLQDRLDASEDIRKDLASCAGRALRLVKS